MPREAERRVLNEQRAKLGHRLHPSRCRPDAVTASSWPIRGRLLSTCSEPELLSRTGRHRPRHAVSWCRAQQTARRWRPPAWARDRFFDTRRGRGGRRSRAVRVAIRGRSRATTSPTTSAVSVGLLTRALAHRGCRGCPRDSPALRSIESRDSSTSVPSCAFVVEGRIAVVRYRARSASSTATSGSPLGGRREHRATRELRLPLTEREVEKRSRRMRHTHDTRFRYFRTSSCPTCCARGSRRLCVSAAWMLRSSRRCCRCRPTLSALRDLRSRSSRATSSPGSGSRAAGPSGRCGSSATPIEPGRPPRGGGPSPPT